jgi:hypothetical protein
MFKFRWFDLEELVEALPQALVLEEAAPQFG